MAELWDSALRRLEEIDSEAADSLRQSDGSAQGNVDALIKDMEEKNKARKNEEWTITIPGIGGGKQRIVSIRRMVYAVMEAAYEFKDVIDKVLEFDPTKYGALAWSVVSFGMNMALNAQCHHEAARQGVTFLAEELTKYARICAEYYLSKSTTARQGLMDSILDAYTALLRYAAELKKLVNASFLCACTPFHPFQERSSDFAKTIVDCSQGTSELGQQIFLGSSPHKR